MVRADFGSGLICPLAQTCCAELRRLARLANSPGFKSFHCPRWRIKFSLERYLDYVAHSFAYPAAGKFSGFKSFHCPSWRIKFSLERNLDYVAHSFAYPAAGKFYRASSAAPPDFRTLYCLKWAKSAEKRHGLPISEAPRCSACANLCAYPAVKNSAGRVPQAADVTCNKISQTRSCRSPRTV